MSTVLYQGLQSCVEPQPRTLRLKLASPKPSFCILDSKPDEKLKDDQECHTGRGWSFMRSLSTVTYTAPKQDGDREAPYVHPLDKHWSSTLGEKSLALCTENLGSETGSDTSESSIFSFSSWDNVVENFPLRETRKKRERSKEASSRSYPPPLTTMRGPESLQCKPHREGGRLIIKLVKTPMKKSLLRVERSHGRIRMSFLKQNNADLDSEENEVKFEEEEGFENETSHCQEEESERMGIEKYHMPSNTSRCKDDRHGKNKEALLNLESFLVATS